MLTSQKHRHTRLSRHAVATLASSVLLFTGMTVVTSGAAVASSSVVAHNVARARPATTHLAARPSNLRAPERTEPRASAYAKTFVVNSLADSPLASPTSTACQDTQGATHCSFRAAIEAANNLNKPVLVELSAGTYDVNNSTAGTMEVTNRGGTTVIGKSEGSTRISVSMGPGYSLFEITEGNNDFGAALTLDQLTISGADGSDGGAIYMAGSNLALVMDNVELIHNSASSDGGALYCFDSSVWATNTIITGNSASSDDGGGIYDYWCNITLTSDTINSNVAGGGGGIFNEYGQIEMTGGSISGNVAGTSLSSGDGGGITDEDGGTTIIDGNVDHNTAHGFGGAVYEIDSRLTTTNTTFNYDSAPWSTGGGGGIAVYEESLSIETLSGDTFEHDTTTGDYYGGAIEVYGYEYSDSLRIDATKFISDNSSAVYLYAEYGGIGALITNSVFQSDSSPIEYSGGALSEYTEYYGGVSAVLRGDTFTHNSASGDYSAGAVDVYSYYGGSDMTAESCTFSDNTATSDYSTGAIQELSYEYSGTTVTIDNSTISGNRALASSDGGGVFVSADGSKDYAGAQLTMSHDVVANNEVGDAGTVGGEGGGILATDYSALNIIDSTVSNNVAFGSGGYESSGGGIADYSNGGTTFIGDTINANRATGADGYGGGISMSPSDAPALVENSTIDGNTADYGAGIYLDEYGLDLEGSTIANNIAGTPTFVGYGGGIYEYFSAVRATNSTIAGNVAVSHAGAASEGGGIYAYSGAISPESGAPLGDAPVVTLYFSTISGNAATKGAGVAMDEGAFGSLRDSILTNNVKVPKSKSTADCFNFAPFDALQSLGGNIIGAGGCVSEVLPIDKVTAASGLSALASNGGPTQTMALSPKSPAVGFAKGDCPSVDQRGVARKANKCDSGAYQLVVKGKPV